MTALRVLAAMSGGVDSAVAAARAAADGHDVTGVHLALSANPGSYRSGARGCCTLEDARDARRAADVIGIPFYVWDLAQRFHDDVVRDFIDEYARGNTPNPCLRCNEKIKFAAVLDRAIALGFDAVCTGHYARLDPPLPEPAGPYAGPGQPLPDPAGQHARLDPPLPEAAGQHARLDPPLSDPAGRPGRAPDRAAAPRRLLRSADPAKDQSYVLAVLTSAQLDRAIFPLGGSTKAQVREEAAARGLAVADKPDSHDVCFIPDGDTRAFLRRQLGDAPGPIVDAAGAVLGRHDGSYGFTVGQRRGLGLDRPAPDGRPRYVLDIEPVTRQVTVGPADGLDITQIEAAAPVWTGCPPPAAPLNCLVQLRAHATPAPATVTAIPPAAGRPATLQISLNEPARGIARGQAAVLYAGDLVLGSATITATTPASPAPVS